MSRISESWSEQGGLSKDPEGRAGFLERFKGRILLEEGKRDIQSLSTWSSYSVKPQALKSISAFV